MINISLKPYLERIVEMHSNYKTGQFGNYICIEDYVLKNGKFYTPKSLPENINRGTKKECYRNAFLLMMDNPQFTYCEGYGTTKAVKGLPFLHAWCIAKI